MTDEPWRSLPRRHVTPRESHVVVVVVVSHGQPRHAFLVKTSRKLRDTWQNSKQYTIRDGAIAFWPRSLLLARGVAEGERTAWTSDVAGQPYPLRRRYFHFRVVAGLSLSREREDRSCRSKLPRYRHSILIFVEARRETRNPVAELITLGRDSTRGDRREMQMTA